MKSTVLALLVFVAPSLIAPETKTYVIDPAATHVVVRVGKGGMFSFAGHTHEVIAPIARGRIIVNPANPAGATADVEFDAKALAVSGAGEPAQDVPEVQKTMDSDRVLDVARFPRITFVGRRVELIGRDGDRLRARASGDLTLHGVTRAVTADVSAAIAPDRLEATGTLTVKQTDFGIEPVTAGGGTVRARNEVEIAFTIVGRPATGTSGNPLHR